MFDIIIRNATIVDGSGSPAYKGDIAIQGERIAEIVDRSQLAEGLQAEAHTIIDGTGKTVTPGFVDVHSHSDFNILINPNGDSKVRQGITTEIVGNCGFSAFPLRGAALEEEKGANARLGLDVAWETAEQYFDKLEAAKPAFNLATFVGHGNVRGSVMGHVDRAPDASELNDMIREVEAACEAGAIGLSTGLIYVPGLFAQTPEIIELQKAATRKGGMYTSHVRGEGDTLLDAADEFFAVIEGAGCQGQFSHLKASGPRNWGKVKRVIEQVENTNRHGGLVRFDKYPYIASSTSLASLLPRWVVDGGKERALERLLDASLKGRIIAESAEKNEGRDGWDSVLICEAGCPDYEKYQGRSVAQIGREVGLDAGEMFVELLVQGQLNTAISNFTMSQEDTDLAILHPLGMVCTDAACRAPSGALAYDCPHPRAYGSFGKFFRDYVRERPLLSLEKAVQKVTALPCETFGFRDRGLVRPNYFADILVLDLPRFEDRADFATPHQFCEGLEAVVVNGALTIADGKATGRRGGRPLRRGRD